MARDWFFVLLNPRADLRSASPRHTEEDKRDDSSDEEEEKNVPTIEDASDDASDDEEPAAKKAKVEKKKKKKSKGSDDDSVNSDVVDDLSGDEVDTSNIIEGGRRSRKGRATTFQYTATDLGEDSDED